MPGTDDGFKASFLFLVKTSTLATKTKLLINIYMDKRDKAYWIVIFGILFVWGWTSHAPGLQHFFVTAFGSFIMTLMLAGGAMVIGQE